MKAQRDLFGRLSLIMQTRHIDLEDVFSYPLGPQSWPLAGMMGGLRKTLNGNGPESKNILVDICSINKATVYDSSQFEK